MIVGVNVTHKVDTIIHKLWTLMLPGWLRSGLYYGSIGAHCAHAIRGNVLRCHFCSSVNFQLLQPSCDNTY